MTAQHDRTDPRTRMFAAGLAARLLVQGAARVVVDVHAEGVDVEVMHHGGVRTFRRIERALIHSLKPIDSLIRAEAAEMAIDAAEAERGWLKSYEECLRAAGVGR